MVVAHRLQYISALLAAGRSVSVHISSNPMTHTEKVKFVIKPIDAFGHPTEACLANALINYLASLAACVPMVDRGHSFSNGFVEVSLFWKHCALQASALDCSHGDACNAVAPPAGQDPLLVGTEPGSAAYTIVEAIAASSWERLPDPAWMRIYAKFPAYTDSTRRWNYILSTLHHAQACTASVQISAHREWRSGTFGRIPLRDAVRRYGLEHGAEEDVPLTRDEVERLGWRRISATVWDLVCERVRGGSRDPAGLSRAFYNIVFDLGVEDFT